MDSTDRDYDDLTRIAGIKNKRQQLLRQSLHVRTFLDFANLPAAEIEAAFKAGGQIVSYDTIKQWQQQARELAPEGNLSSQQPVESPDAPGEQWIQFASFVVAFETRKVDDQEEKQTTVHYVEQDTGETWQGPSWAGIVSEQPCLWMMEQLHEKAQLELEEAQTAQKPSAKLPSVEPAPVEASPPEPSLTEPPPIRVEVIEIRAFQPPDIDTPSGIGKANQPFAGVLKGGEPFALEVAFRLPEPAIADLVTKATMYLANFYVRNMATHISTFVGDTETDSLAPGQTSYTARLPQVILQPGNYRLGVLVKLRTRSPSINYLEASLLQVI